MKRSAKAYVSQFYRHNMFAFFGCCVGELVNAAINIGCAALIKSASDTITGEPGAMSLNALFISCAAILAAIVLQTLLIGYARPAYMRRASLQYKSYVLNQLMEKSVVAMRSQSTSLYLSALSNDMNTIEENYLLAQFSLLNYAAWFVGSLAAMLLYSPLLTAVSVALTLLPTVASILTGGLLKNAEAQVAEKNATFLATLKDVLSGFSVIKAFRAEKAVSTPFAESSAAAENAKSRRRRLTVLVGGIGTLTGVAAQLGVFLFGAILARRTGGVTAGTVIAFVSLMNGFISPISAIPGLWANRKAALALIERLAAALEETPSVGAEAMPSQLRQGIRLENVRFQYEPDKPILRGVSAELPAGGCYAIVGASGSGKTTLLNLLLPSGETYMGNICYDGREVRSIDADSLYRTVALIEQNVFVFNASIRDNITMFQSFEDAQVDRVIHMAGLSMLIQQKGEGYLCGENGCNLSGGEKQRISIARSLLRRSSVLLADEATSALDTQTAWQITDAILRLDKLTRIIVTHTLDAPTLKRYNRIFVLKNGQIEESGTFDELMERQSYFYSLYTVSQ